MSLDESRIPKLIDSSRKFIPQKQRKAMNDPFVKRIALARTDKGQKVSGGMVETKSQKSSEGQKARFEVEVHPHPAIDENREGHGPEGRGNRRLANESTPVEQGQDFATSTGTLDREEMSELSDISTENMATTRSPTDNTYDAWSDGETGNVLLVFRNSEEHFGKLLSLYHGNGHRRRGRNPGR